MVCADIQDAGHRVICATMHRLGSYCVWERMKEETVSLEMVQKYVAGWMAIQELWREVLERVRAARDRKRVAASAGSIPNFEDGNFVLVARVSKLSSAPLLMTAWIGQWRIVLGGCAHVYSVQDIVTGEKKGFTWYGCVPMRIRLLLWVLMYRACSR